MCKVDFEMRPQLGTMWLVHCTMSAVFCWVGNKLLLLLLFATCSSIGGHFAFFKSLFKFLDFEFLVHQDYLRKKWPLNVFHMDTKWRSTQWFISKSD